MSVVMCLGVCVAVCLLTLTVSSHVMSTNAYPISVVKRTPTRRTYAQTHRRTYRYTLTRMRMSLRLLIFTLPE